MGLFLRLFRVLRAALAGSSSEVGLTLGEVDHHSELELVLEVESLRGSVLLSEEIWRRMGEVAGWTQAARPDEEE